MIHYSWRHTNISLELVPAKDKLLFSCALEEVSHGTFPDFYYKHNFNQWKKIQLAFLIATILVLHAPKDPLCFQPSRQTGTSESVSINSWKKPDHKVRQGCERERKKGKQEASKIKRYYQGGWALKSYGISSGTASYDMNSYSGFTDGLGEPLETPGKFSCLCLSGRGVVGFYHILNPKPIME